MLEIFIFYFLIHNGLVIIADKYNVSNVIYNLSNKIESKLLYEISECNFCLTFHIAFFMLTLPMIIITHHLEYFMFAFTSASLMNITNKLKK